MDRVSKTLAQSVVLLAAVMSPVAVSAIQIATGFESIPASIEEELVSQDSDTLSPSTVDSQDSDTLPPSTVDSQDSERPLQSAPASQDASRQPEATRSATLEGSRPQAGSTVVATAAKSLGNNPNLAIQQSFGASGLRVSSASRSFSSPGKWHSKSQFSFMSNTPAVSFGSGSSWCCDIGSDGDIFRLMVFAQPSPMASSVDVGSLMQFTDLSAGFSQVLAPTSGQSHRGRAAGGDRSQGASSGGGIPAANRDSARLVTASGSCGCGGGACGDGAPPADGLITAVARMIKQFANCLIFDD